MNNMKGTVYLFHGKTSSPDSEKLNRLGTVAQIHGYNFNIPDFVETDDPEERVGKALDLSYDDKVILVGASMGAYVATIVAQKINPRGLFLLGPAFYLPNYKIQEPEPVAERVTLIHGWDDERTPAKNAIQYAEKYRTELHLLHSDHRLANEISRIESIFATFLGKLAEG